MSKSHQYLALCDARGLQPVDEFIAILSDPSPDRCVLTNLGRELNDTDIICMAPALGHESRFKEIDLQDNDMTAEGAKTLGHALTGNATLTRLSVGGNNIGDEGIASLAESLRSNWSLTAIDIKSNNIADIGIAAFAEVLAANSTLVHLDAQRNNIRCQGVIALAAAFQVNSSLQVVNLRFNEISDSGATALGKALQFNTSITELDLGGNLVGSEGAVQLVGALHQNKTLRKLNLRSNSILDAGAIAVAQMCKKNNTLTELYLGSNGIAEDGCTALADSWRVNNSLTKVDLQGATVGRSGAFAIAEALKVNHSLTQLVLEVEHTNRDGAAAIAAALRSNTTITELVIGDSGLMDEAVLAAINSTLRVNKFISGIGNGTVPKGNQTPAQLSAVPQSVPKPAIGSPPPSALTAVALSSSPPPPPALSPASMPAQPRNRRAGSAVAPNSPPQRHPINLTQHTHTHISPPGRHLSPQRSQVALKRSVSPPRDHGLDARLEQIAQAVELRLQTQDSQIVHLSHQLEAERLRSDKLVELVEAQKLGLQRMEEGLEAQGRAHELQLNKCHEAVERQQAALQALREEVRWVDEENIRQRVEEAAKTKEAMQEMEDRLTRPGGKMLPVVSEALGPLEMKVGHLQETGVHLVQLVGDTSVDDRVAALDTKVQKQMEAAHQALTEARQKEMTELTQQQQEAIGKLTEEIRWVDEESIRCRVEDEAKTRAALQEWALSVQEQLASNVPVGMRESLGSLEERLSAAEAMLTGEGSATLVSAVERVGTLTSAVAQLTSHLQDKQVKEMAVAAENRLHGMEAKVLQLQQDMADQSQRAMQARSDPTMQQAVQDLHQRIQMLERSIRHEQESSLKALEAILKAQS